MARAIREASPMRVSHSPLTPFPPVQLKCRFQDSNGNGSIRHRAVEQPGFLRLDALVAQRKVSPVGVRFSRPFGTCALRALVPGVETPGYSRLSLRVSKCACRLQCRNSLTRWKAEAAANRCRKIPFGLENRIANFHENGTGKVYTAASGCRCAGGRIWSVSLTPCHSQNTVLQLPGSQRDPFSLPSKPLHG